MTLPGGAIHTDCYMLSTRLILGGGGGGGGGVRVTSAKNRGWVFSLKQS